MRTWQRDFPTDEVLALISVRMTEVMVHRQAGRGRVASSDCRDELVIGRHGAEHGVTNIGSIPYAGKVSSAFKIGSGVPLLGQPPFASLATRPGGLF